MGISLEIVANPSPPRLLESIQQFASRKNKQIHCIFFVSFAGDCKAERWFSALLDQQRLQERMTGQRDMIRVAVRVQLGLEIRLGLTK